MLDFFQLYYGIVLFSKKTEIMSSVHVICIKERSHSVSNFLQGKFPRSPLLGFLLHTQSIPHLPSKCLGNVFTLEQHKLRGFLDRITPAIVPGLSQEHSQSLWAALRVTGWNHNTGFRAAQSCLSTAQTSWWQSPKGVLQPWVHSSLKDINWWRVTCWWVRIYCFPQERPGELWLSPHQSHVHRHKAPWPTWVENHAKAGRDLEQDQPIGLC